MFSCTWLINSAAVLEVDCIFLYVVDKLSSARQAWSFFLRLTVFSWLGRYSEG